MMISWSTFRANAVVLLMATSAFGQTGSIVWSAFSTGYESGTGSGSAIQGIAGQIFVGTPDTGASGITSGFFPGAGSPVVTSAVALVANWNMVSVPVISGNFQRTSLFPTSISEAFSYSGGYFVAPRLANGYGYWLKFSQDQVVDFTGTRLDHDTVDVTGGWNMIGSISDTVAVASIGSIPSGMVTSSFFGYEGSYFIADRIAPGRGYWVKVAESGKLVLSLHGMNSPSNRIRIVPTSERPPAGPDGEAQMPRVFALEQNYPNPFNPSTVIRYTVPDPSPGVEGHQGKGDGGVRVTLKVYDVLGREVRTLIDGNQEPGTRSILWDAAGMTSGVYFYTLSIGIKSETRKMILLR